MVRRNPVYLQIRTFVLSVPEILDEILDHRYPGLLLFSAVLPLIAEVLHLKCWIQYNGSVVGWHLIGFLVVLLDLVPRSAD